VADQRTRRKAADKPAAERALLAFNRNRDNLVAELLQVETELAAAEDGRRTYLAEYKAHREALTTHRNEILAELRGEGRQLRLPGPKSKPEPKE
jgi:hypothetical protein